MKHVVLTVDHFVLQCYKFQDITDSKPTPQYPDLIWFRQKIRFHVNLDVLTRRIYLHKRVFGSTTRVTQVSSDNVVITADHLEPVEVSQSGNTNNPPVYGEYKCYLRGGLWCPCGGFWCRMWQVSIFIWNRWKRKITDIGRCANDQSVPDKTGCSCRTTTRGVRLARQGCWYCAFRSS